MRVQILYFGLLKDAVGSAAESWEAASGISVGELLQALCVEHPKLAKYSASWAVSVNQEFSRTQVKLKDGDEVALLPPVSGGKESRASIVHHVIDQQEVLRSIKRPADGAVSLFDGIVRDHTKSRQTQYLIYEAYGSMALKTME